MSKMALPVLPATFPKAPANTFVLGNNDTRIAATKQFDVDSVRVGAVDYTPTITTYTMTLQGSTVETYAYVHTPISPGIDAYCEITYATGLALGTRSDGTQSLTWVQLQNPVKRSWYTVATWVTITEAIADLILAVIAIVIGDAIAQIERTVVRVVVAALVGGVVSAVATVLEHIPEWIAGEAPDGAPSLDALVSNATANQTWSDSKDFELTHINLNGGLQMGGNPFTG
ncbi:TULIP family P47-like protein [Streptomyces sp. NPDC088794]|uniref:TULIP family P47-like protein n=1 Tax=Streptomyces sp. NPDC088794 TaxID=3365902 RepID=UPI0038301D01